MVATVAVKEAEGKVEAAAGVAAMEAAMVAMVAVAEKGVETGHCSNTICAAKVEQRRHRSVHTCHWNWDPTGCKIRLLE